MSIEQSHALVRRIAKDILNGKNLGLIDELYTPNFVGHQIPPSMPNGPAGLKAFFGYFFAAFPDFRVTFEDEVAEGDKLAARGRFTGTHKGEFQGVPASGKRVEVNFMDEWRIENGRVAEYWAAIDTLSLLQQIGALPAR